MEAKTKNKKEFKEFRVIDLVTAIKSGSFASVTLLLICFVQGVAFANFYQTALPHGFSGNAGLCFWESVIFSIFLIGVIVKILLHQSEKDKIDSLTITTLSIIIVSDFILLNKEIWFRGAVMQLFVIGQIVLSLFILIFSLHIYYDNDKNA